MKAWDQFYMTLEEKVVKQKVMEKEYYLERKDNVFHHIHETLEKLGIVKLVLLYQPFCPELI